MQSVSGGGHSGGGIFINTEDHARFGLLFLNEGNWNGTQLLSKSWIKNAISSSNAQISYGYMWWLNKKGTSRFWEGVPENVYYAAGFGGNFIVNISAEVDSSEVEIVDSSKTLTEVPTVEIDCGDLLGAITIIGISSLFKGKNDKIGADQAAVDEAGTIGRYHIDPLFTLRV